VAATIDATFAKEQFVNQHTNQTLVVLGVSGAQRGHGGHQRADDFAISQRFAD
jgi:hypothetical protein